MDDKDLKIKKLESEVTYLRRLKARNERVITELLQKDTDDGDRPQEASQKPQAD